MPTAVSKTLSSNERRWLLLYKAQIARGEVCPDCDSTTRIHDDGRKFLCLACHHSWTAEEMEP
jgi:transposase-like protein